MTQTQNRGNVVILRMASVSLDLDKTFFPLRRVLAAWLVVPKVLTQKKKKKSYEHKTGECLINQKSNDQAYISWYLIHNKHMKTA